ncbi:hypothetical protein BDZ97DRAFT_817598 [Flammula alnicola]|nr:hypothetical protein BDZ97DRAFT_817598 [Flammula alnicola]
MSYNLQLDSWSTNIALCLWRLALSACGCDAYPCNWVAPSTLATVHTNHIALSQCSSIPQRTDSKTVIKN